jgi:hypothetical protein
MIHTNHNAVSASVPQVTESIDFSDELDLFGGSLAVQGARRIRRSGFYNKADRKPAGWRTQGAVDYSLKSESPVLVKLANGTVAVASAEGLAAYLVRTGQAA